VAYAPNSETDTGRLLGKFVNAETRAVFEYGELPDEDRPFGPEYRLAVWQRDGSYRYSRVLKTVAYVVVNEADDGSPVVERWEICRHREYF
jgi:hypothetical protein